MPKKRTASKKKAAKKSAPVTRNQSLLTRPILARSQQEFHEAHPNAELLIGLFILSFIVLAASYYFRMYA